MSSFRVHIGDDKRGESFREPRTPDLSPVLDARESKRKRPFLKALKIIGIVLVILVLLGGTGAYLYWQSFKNTPQYSLALLVDSAKRDDQAAVNELINVDAVVDDFLPQITGKAIEIYGRGLPPKTIERFTQVAAPIMPALKDRARAELPRVIRERTEKFGTVPFILMVLGASRYLDIKVNGDTAQVSSKLQDRPLEVKMKRNGDKWQIVGVKDDVLATQIAQKIGQEIIAIAKNGNLKNAGETLGLKNLSGLLKQAEEILNK